MGDGRSFDSSRAHLGRPDRFPRFRTEQAAEIEARRLAADTRLLVFERGGERRGLLVRQMVYHHAAQGTLAGEPYLVTF